MAKIYAPNEKYTGISASVTFADGVGETNDEHLLEWFAAHGYRVVVEEVYEETEPEVEVLPAAEDVAIVEDATDESVPSEEPEPEEAVEKEPKKSTKKGK